MILSAFAHSQSREMYKYDTTQWIYSTVYSGVYKGSIGWLHSTPIDVHVWIYSTSCAEKFVWLHKHCLQLSRFMRVFFHKTDDTSFFTSCLATSSSRPALKKLLGPDYMCVCVDVPWVISERVFHCCNFPFCFFIQKGTPSTDYYYTWV